MSDTAAVPGTTPSTEELAGILVSDETAPRNLPTDVDGFPLVGHVVNWNQTPSFMHVAVLLEPGVEVRPGQFVGVLHRRRGINALTIIQVGNCFEVNPNEMPELAAARSALGLGRAYGQEGTSTRIYRLAECATVEDFDLHPDGNGFSISG